MNRNVFRLAAILLAAATVSPLACEIPDGVDLAAADRDRMAGFEASRVEGLGAALLSDSQSERHALSALFATAGAPLDTIPDGKYRCRTMKLGGILPLTAYDFFGCRITEDGTRIEKTSGSQRFSGDLVPTAQAMFYRGALSYNDDPALAYGEDPERNQVGCLYQAGNGSYRLELPSPLFESVHDVIELIPVAQGD